MTQTAREKNTLNFEQVRDYLPQRFPMLMVDKVLDYEKGKWLRALKNLSGNDIAFLGHFPRRALMPGAFILEGVGQCIAILFQLTYGGLGPDDLPLFGLVNARFLRPVFPGDQLIYEVNVVKITSSAGVFTGQARVDGELVVRGELSVGKRASLEWA